MLNALCMECGSILHGFGNVICKGCRTIYIIKRIPNRDVVFFNGEADTKTFNVVEMTRSYLPRLQSQLVEYVDVESDHDVVDSINSIPNETICVICKKRLQHIMSVRVQTPMFIEYDALVEHPISKQVFTEVRSRPSFKIGRAHSHCALSNPRYEMVDPKCIPNKRERSQGNRENDRLLDHWKIIDPSDLSDWE